jgi:hypothetical protein
VIKDGLAAPVETIIVSGEDLCRIRNVSRLAPLKSSFDVRVLCYLRRQDDWLESWYNQHVKWPWDAAFSTMPPQQFLERRGDFHWLDYAEMLGRWRAELGRESLIVRPYERAQMPGSVVEDFCRLCGIDFGSLKVLRPAENASVPARGLTMLRQLNLYGKQGPQRTRLISGVNRAFAVAGLADGVHVFSPRQRREIASAFTEGNAKVAREYLGRDDGALFREPLPADDPTPPDLSLPPVPELCERIAGPLVAGYVSDIEKLLENTTSTPEQDQEQLRISRARSHWLERRARANAVLSSRLALLQRLASQLTGGLSAQPGSAAATGSPAPGSVELPADPHLPAAARELLRLLSLSERPNPDGEVVLDTLREWHPLLAGESAIQPAAHVEETTASGVAPDQREGDRVSVGVPQEPEAFTREWLEPLLDLLGHRLINARKMARQPAKPVSPEIQRARRELTELKAQVRALEASVATPAKTAARLWRLLRTGV